MSLEILLTVMPPPMRPAEAPVAEDWRAVEVQLGVALPEDYKHFIQKYGTGKISDFLWIFSPFTTRENLNLHSQIEVQRAVLDELRSFGEPIPYDYFPIAGGLLPFGMSANGDVLFWKTCASSEQWPVVVNEARSPSWEVFDIPMAQFIFDILSGKRSSKILPLDSIVESPRFDPA
jgi:hypothetical protein